MHAFTLSYTITLYILNIYLGKVKFSVYKHNIAIDCLQWQSNILQMAVALFLSVKCYSTLLHCRSSFQLYILVVGPSKLRSRDFRNNYTSTDKLNRKTKIHSRSDITDSTTNSLTENYSLSLCTPAHKVRLIPTTQTVCNVYCICCCLYIQATLYTLCAFYAPTNTRSLAQIQLHDKSIVKCTNELFTPANNGKKTSHASNLGSNTTTNACRYHTFAAFIVILYTKQYHVSTLLCLHTSKIRKTVGACKKLISGRSLVALSSPALRGDGGLTQGRMIKGISGMLYTH